MAALPRGRMVDVLVKAQSAFATPASGNYARTPIYAINLGEKFGLPDDPILNPARVNDRDMTAPAPDVRRHDGSIGVPLCLRNIGIWLTAVFGAPLTTAVAAEGSIVFSGQPAAGSSITINGSEFVFVADDPSSGEIEIGGSLAATLANAVTVLNGSGNADVAAATYDDDSADTLTIVHDTAGPNGNEFTLAAAANSNGTVSAPTLTGGCYRHVFTSGGAELPSYSVETRLRSAGAGGPRFLRHIGVMINAMTLRLQWASGNHRVDLEALGRHEEDHTSASQGGTPTELELLALPAVRGVFTIGGVSLGPVLAVEATYRNGLTPLEWVADSPYVSGYEPGDSAFSGSLRTRFVNETVYDYARAASVLDVGMEWPMSPGFGLALAAPRMRLEKPAIGIEGPGGIELTFPFRGEQDAVDPMLTATLSNDVAAY